MTTILKQETRLMRYTVELNTLEEGAISFVAEHYTPKVGDYVTDVQFVDKFKNNMSKNGIIKRIIRKRELDHRD
tara:strand:- start:2150 stop:2371 length:222 start_codon:yes stop_codon:yes gene_type:complete